MIRFFLILALIFTVFSEQTQSEVLVLNDKNFLTVINENENFFVLFETTWCKQCKALHQVLTQLTEKLSQSNSTEVKVARIDATQSENILQIYKGNQYPHIVYLHKGIQVNYKGRMSADHIVAWLQKKQLDPLIPLDQESYQRIQKLNKVSIVYHGDPSSLEADEVRKIALADEHNTYYVTSIGKRQGMVQILSGSQVLRVNHKVDHSLSRWIRNHERPIVVPFDDRTISDMFKNNKPTLCLFNKGGSPQILQEFTESAISYLQLGKQLVFTHLNETSDFRHFKEFAQYIKINPQKTPIVLIDIKTRSKYVIEQKAEEIYHQDITYFLEQWKSGTLKKYDVIGTNDKQTRAEQL